MTIYFQHVGAKGGQRDFPRTIGTRAAGLKHFSFDDIAGHLDSLSEIERQRVRAEAAEYAPEGFQIWGIPSGARAVLRNFAIGDYLLLLETVGVDGRFHYAGRAVSVFPRECFELSQFLWGEAKFPLIVLLMGELTDFPWPRFSAEFDFKPHWNPAGQTYRLRNEKLEFAPYDSEDDVIRAFIGHDIELGPAALIEEDLFLEPGEADFTDQEGRKLLRLHVVCERSASLVRNFKASLSSFVCQVCDFDFFQTYGELGRNYIEAHHTKPVAELKPGEKVSIRDLIPVCSNCHRMLHRRTPPVGSEELIEIMVETMQMRNEP